MGLNFSKQHEVGSNSVILPGTPKQAKKCQLILFVFFMFIGFTSCAPIEKKPGDIRFVFLSDTHNRTDNLDVPPGDILIHSGDFTLASHESEYIRFNEFCKKLKETKGFKEIIVIAGNHDMSLDKKFSIEFLEQRKRHSKDPLTPEKCRSILKDVTYLEDSEVTVEGFRIYGSPVTPYYGGMGFEHKRGEEIKKVWDKIPSGLDFLITHGPPHKILDYVPHSKAYAGCEELREAILKRAKPKFHIFGHIHEGNEGEGVKKEGDTTFINAAICSVEYKPVQKIHWIDLPKKKDEI